MRIRSLDILRGVAVLLVIGRHWKPSPDGYNPVAGALIDAWEQCGWIGVDLFFVLSGFLIAGLLFREHQARGKVDIKRFLVRRAFKIYPPFYVLVVLGVGVNAAIGNGYPLRSILSEVAFLQNYLYRIFPHTWSLAVEEHFYFALPIVMLVLLWRAKSSADPFRPLVTIFLVVAATLLLLRIWGAWSAPFSAGSHMYRTHLRVDSLLFGVVLSYWMHYRPASVSRFVERWRPCLLPAGILLAVPALWLPLSHPFMHTAGFTCLYVGFGLILLAALHARERRGMLLEPPARLLSAIGACSYSIYLWHAVVLSGGLGTVNYLANGTLTYGWALVIYVTGSVVVGMGMSRLVEARALVLRDRLFPSMSRPLPAARDYPPPPSVPSPVASLAANR